MSWAETVKPPYVVATNDAVVAEQAHAMEEFYNRIWMPEILRFDFEVGGLGYINQARYILKRGTLRWIRTYTFGAVNPGSFTLNVCYVDGGGLIQTVWAVPGDRVSAVAGVVLFNEKAPTAANLPVFDRDVNNAKFIIDVTAYVPGPWPGVTVELIFVPA